MATGRIPTTANSPLTVKGDLFGYSTTQARVPVGNDGETLVADSSATTGLRYGANFAAGKNKIINGDFYVNQRAFSSTTSTAIYTFDRWRTTVLGDGTATFTAQTFTPGTAPVSGYEGKNYLRIVTASQTAVGTFTDIRQRIENVRTLAGQTATISFFAKAASGTPKVAVELQQAMGSGGSPSSTVQIYAGQVTLSTSWARYSLTIAIPSLSGKTLGTDENSDLGVEFIVSAGSDFNARTGSLGIQSNTFELWGMQIEAGSTATTFTTATGTIQGELAACQRYYQRNTAITIYNRHSQFAPAANSTQIFMQIQNPVPMRVTPTSVDYSSISAYDNVNIINAITPTIDSGSNNLLTTLLSATSGLTQYRNYAYIGTTSSSYLGLSAEL